MAVQIRIKGNKSTNEYKDAIALKEIFETEFRSKEINGEILIISGATLFGQETKDVDLIAIGQFERYRTQVKTKARTADRNEEPLDQIKRTVFVNDFCFVFETKRHRAEDVRLDGTNLLVKYGKKRSDVTTQSENQKYALTNYFKDRINFSPYICNFIWLRNVSWGSIKGLLGENENIYDKHNYLPNTFRFPFLMQLACIQSMPYNSKNQDGSLKNYCSFNSVRRNQNLNFQELNSIFDLFNRVKDGQGELSRKKIEKITNRLLSNQQYAQAIGEKLIVISGRAGTGKTIKLLSIACDLGTQQGARSLILTYNHALVSDIKRTLALAEVPDGIDDYTVGISTLHKFFYEILVGFEIGTEVSKNGKKFIRNFVNPKRYSELLNELKEYIDEELIGDEEIDNLIKSNHQQVGWDYILIDEAQDWGELEKGIIFKIFGKEKVIIADGVDQLIRSQNKCNWTRALKPNVDFKKTHEKKGLRQKVNLVNFVNSFADTLNIKWELEAKQELIGGKVIIIEKDYDKDFHGSLFEKCISNGNSAYEYMFLVPPSLVEKHSIKDRFGETKQDRRFVLKDQFENSNIKIWDGTSRDLRTQYAVDLDQHRLFQYESCRGLEGWTVVCLNFDDFIKYKLETFTEEKEEGVQKLFEESFEEKRHKFVYLWALIPLTRAIDTLVLQVKNTNSYVAEKLKEVYEDNPDFVEWIKE